MKDLLIALLVCPVLSGGEFVNLTFDEPDLTNVRPFKPPGEYFERQYAPAEEVFQGWTISQVFLDELKLSAFQGLANVDAGGSTLSLAPYGGLNTRPYAVEVGVRLGINWERSAFSLSQVGLVPGDADTLRWWNDSSPQIRINGEALTPQSVDPLLQLYEVNVTAYAGQEVELSLDFAKGSHYEFDLIGFIPIPEPSPATLLIIGGLFMMFCHRRRA